MRTVYGFDGSGIQEGDRVELHPACDLWMMGARFGNVTKLTQRSANVLLDKIPGKVIRVAHDLLRRSN